MAVPCHVARVAEEEGGCQWAICGRRRSGRVCGGGVGFRQLLVAGGVLSEPMVAAADADEGGAVFVGDRWVGEVGLGG